MFMIKMVYEDVEERTYHIYRAGIPIGENREIHHLSHYRQLM